MNKNQFKSYLGKLDGCSGRCSGEAWVSEPPEVQLTEAQQQVQYAFTGINRNGKPEFEIPAASVINFKSAFAEKGLCTGPTFTAGLACHFSCSYCYVAAQLSRNPAVLRITKETGLSFDQLSIVKETPLSVLKRQLFDSRGCLRKVANQFHVIFGSPVVDVAANLETARRTVELCRFILEHTNWHIRLLSKSVLLLEVACELSAFKDRLILGFSTGTLNEPLAAATEKGTSRVSARIKALHWLQNNGFRTFGMLCPILPVENVEEYIAAAVQVLQVDRLEHVWAEVLNARGNSLRRTVEALAKADHLEVAVAVEQIAQDRVMWERSARRTFDALCGHVPRKKLRFLQYVQPGTLEWWWDHVQNGAILLGSQVRPQERR
jgi:DNA repair photolyase